ncbi:MAG: tetratricopeptide repeat protein [Acidobacteriota bacterium]
MSEFECAVQRASSLLEPAIGRSLKIKGKVPWFGGMAGGSVYDLRRDLIGTVTTGKAEIVVGLATGGAAARPPGIDGEPYIDLTKEEGLAAYSRGYVVMKVGAGDLCGIYRLLAHEIAHVFGGIHRRGDNYLMDRDSPGVEIDPLNAELFSLHRERSFAPGAAPLEGEELRSMWRLARADLDAPKTWMSVGVLAARMGKPEAAVRYYEMALEKDPDYLLALINLGHARFQLGELEAAEECYLRALQLGPDDGLVHNNLAAIYCAIGSPQQAVSHLRKALSLHFPVNPQFIVEVERLTGERIRRR